MTSGVRVKTKLWVWAGVVVKARTKVWSLEPLLDFEWGQIPLESVLGQEWSSWHSRAELQGSIFSSNGSLDAVVASGSDSCSGQSSSDVKKKKILFSLRRGKSPGCFQK